MEIDNLLESEQVADGDVINIIDVGYNNDNVLQTYRGTEVRTELTWGRCTGTHLFLLNIYCTVLTMWYHKNGKYIM